MASTSTVHISLFNAEVTKIITSLLKYLYSSLAWHILLHSDPSCHYWNSWYDSDFWEPLAELFRAYSWRQCFFFSFRVFLLEVPPFSDREKCRGLNWAGAFSEWAEGSSQGYQVDEAYNLAVLVWVKRLPCGQRWSISMRMRVWRLLIVSLTNASQLSSFHSRYSTWAKAWVFLKRIEWDWTLHIETKL